MLSLPSAEEVAVESSPETWDEYGTDTVDSVVGNGVVNVVSDPVIATVELTPSSGIPDDDVWLGTEVAFDEVSKVGAGRVKL